MKESRQPVLRIHDDELIVDSFAGGGGASVGIGWALGRDPDIAINHNAEAIAMHKANHPNTKHYVADVFDVDPLEACGMKRPWKKGDPFKVGLFWMSPDCFPAGTMILTREGFRPIEEIAVGDEVLTHQKRWRKVTVAMRTLKPLVRLRGHGHPGLMVSPEHPFYARLRKDVWRTPGDASGWTRPRGYERTLEPAGWVPAADLDNGWYWSSPAQFPEAEVPPIPLGKNRREMTISEDLLWLAGLYVADGWTRLTPERGELVITCGMHEVQELREKLCVWQRAGERAGVDELAFQERETRTAYQFSTTHRGLVVWLREHFGHGAAEKTVPGWALGMPENLRRAFLSGYLAGDGCVSHGDGSPRTMATTVSKSLVFGLKLLVQSFGFDVSVALRTDQPDVIAGRKVNVRPAWSVAWRESADPSHRQAIQESGFSWSAIRERVDNVCDEAEVFNLSVEDDESYVADGIVVHNCTFHSKARGKKPHRDRDPARRRRGLANIGLKWMRLVHPRAVALENVEEFEDWGPLIWDEEEGGWVPDPDRMGLSFRRFVKECENLGYKVEWRQLRACDYGAPTNRKRLFMFMRCDGYPIEWPNPTHGPAPRPLPFRTAAECIDWSIPCGSIFMTPDEVREWKRLTGRDVRRPLSDDTLRRIAAGIDRYVLNNENPFVVPGFGAPVLIQTSWGERVGQRPRYLNIHEPVGTIMADGIKHSVAQVRLERADLVAAFVAKHYGGEHENGKPKAVGSDARTPLGTITGRDHNYLITAHLTNLKGRMDDRLSSSMDPRSPMPTICAGGNHIAQVYAFLVAYYGTDQDPRLGEPMHTLTTKDRMALVTVTIAGQKYAIVDICMRMLEPHELFRAQGFPEDYKIDPIVEREVRRGKKIVKVAEPLGRTAQVQMCGNSVSPKNAEALLTSNFPVLEVGAGANRRRKVA